MIGKTYNDITVLSINKTHKKNKRKYYNCLCVCGKKTIVRYDQIKNGHTKSCGCLKVRRMKKLGIASKINLMGQSFGRLSVVGESTKRAEGKHGNYFWVCECSCGNKTTVRSSYLRNGQVVSCGCYHRDIISGSKNPNFKPFLTDEHRWKSRNQLNGSSQATFRGRVLRRDGHTCKICRKTDKLVAHHLNSYDNHVSERFDVNNGKTLCTDCHTSFHKTFGYGNNTIDQYIKFKQGGL